MTFANQPEPTFEPEPDAVIAWAKNYYAGVFSSQHQAVVMDMNRLSDVAGATDADGKYARAFLDLMVTQYNATDISARESGYISSVAAQTIVRLSYDADIRDELFPVIRRALGYCPSLSPNVRLQMLDALEAYAHDRLWREDNTRELAEIVFKAMRTEFERARHARDQRFQVRLLFLMRMVGGNESLPFLDAIADAADDPEVKDLARLTSRYMVLSLEKVWSETREDRVSLPESRAMRLEETSSLDLSEAELIQSIFNEMKGCPVRSDADPRLESLGAFLADERARIKLAAAFALGMSLSSEQLLSQGLLAVDVLTDFAIHCNAPEDINDSLLALKRLGDNSAVFRQAIYAAKERANEEFIRSSW